MDKLKQHIQNNIHELDIEEPKADLWSAISSEISRAENADPLKEHIEQYAEELDVEMPAEHAWSRIKSAINQHKPVRQISYKKLAYYVAAASLIIFIVVGTLVYKNLSGGSSNGEDLVATPSKPESAAPSLRPVDTMKAMTQAPSETQGDKEQLKAEKKQLAQTVKKDFKKNVAIRQPNSKIPKEIIEAQAEYDNLIAGQVSLIQNMPLYGESAGDFAGFVDDFRKLDQQEKKLRSAVLKKGMGLNTMDELAMIYQKKLTVLKMLQREISRTDIRSFSENDTIPVFIKLKNEL